MSFQGSYIAAIYHCKQRVQTVQSTSQQQHAAHTAPDWARSSQKTVSTQVAVGNCSLFTSSAWLLPARLAKGTRNTKVGSQRKRCSSMLNQMWCRTAFGRYNCTGAPLHTDTHPIKPSRLVHQRSCHHNMYSVTTQPAPPAK